MDGGGGPLSSAPNPGLFWYTLPREMGRKGGRRVGEGSTYSYAVAEA